MLRRGQQRSALNKDQSGGTPLDAAIVASWRRHEQAEPDISTERLMEMVRG
jgi:hypothetical protein